ncbi:hypothetical protein ACEN9X_09410 [Mucilaginibacter sp. Mucisp86]|uniref:hypothetical protein n=1 Tax=Mucilaginibacter sp. Mucisp86 TaxID=3243060 RepID=UPI0039B5FA22
MEKTTIYYEISINLTLKNKKGKIRKGYYETGLGNTYESALWYVYFTLKKRGYQILEVKSAVVKGVAFAYNSAGDSVKVNLADCMPAIPDDLNKEVQNLPKKKSL